MQSYDSLRKQEISEEGPGHPGRLLPGRTDLCAEQREELQAALELQDSPELIHRFWGESRLVRLDAPFVPQLPEILATLPWSPRHTGILEAFRQIRPLRAISAVSSFLGHPAPDTRLAVMRTCCAGCPWASSRSSGCLGKSFPSVISVPVAAMC